MASSTAALRKLQPAEEPVPGVISTSTKAAQAALETREQSHGGGIQVVPALLPRCPSWEATAGRQSCVSKDSRSCRGFKLHCFCPFQQGVGALLSTALLSLPGALVSAIPRLASRPTAAGTGGEEEETILPS